MSARTTIRTVLVGTCGLALVATLPAPGHAAPDPATKPAAPVSAAYVRHTEKNPTAYGTGGAVSSVDPEATNAGLRVLKRGATRSTRPSPPRPPSG